MASRDFSCGPTEIYVDKVLGVGSYGKVCRAKSGQLPCAAKLLHDTLFQDNDPGTRTLARRFEQECNFLSNIKHPNIVQYLGTMTDPKSHRPVLLMELMDVNLTRFLGKFTTSLPFHSQLNICHDVALALAYLHSNTIIHRDLSSNNVLLIGEGCKAKVTDFGMSKLTERNPHMTPLTQCPGTSAYMPPEALITPPHYSSKLDVFSHGVLTIQIITRNFPNPGDAITYVDDPKYPSGRVLIQIPETDRRKRDIDLIEADHPLLPTALNCIKDRDTKRPSADELCEGLASLKNSVKFKDSVEQTREITSRMTQSWSLLVEAKKCQHQEKDTDQREHSHGHYQQKLERLTVELRESRAREQQYREKLEALMTKLNGKIGPHEQQEIGPPTHSKINPNTLSVRGQPQNKPSDKAPVMRLTWRQGKPAPVNMSSLYGAAVVHGNIAYFSQDCRVYSYTLPENEWTQLPPCSGHENFGLAVVNDSLTTVGGWSSSQLIFGHSSNSLLSLAESGIWEKLLPSMPTPRALPATLTTITHLVVAGGRGEYGGNGLSTVEVMDTDTLQWSTASSLPQGIDYPLMTSCGGFLYISDDDTVFSCSVEGLFTSSDSPSHKPASANSSSSKGGSVWTRLADIPVDSGPTLLELEGHLLAIGGDNGGQPTGVIHCYDISTDSWKVKGKIPTPRNYTLAAVLPNNKLMVVGGEGQLLDGQFSINEISQL